MRPDSSEFTGPTGPRVYVLAARVALRPLDRHPWPPMSSYYDPADLDAFAQVSEHAPELGKKFFDWYGSVFQDGALSAREKSLIALGVAHAVQCPYCIEAYTKDGLAKGCDPEQVTEVVHVAAAIKGGAALVHGMQMKKVSEKLGM